MAPMIVVAGEALIDLLVGVDGALRAIPGGGPFNTARTIARLGGSVTYLGCLSTDRFGGILREALLADGVDLSLTETTFAPTTLAVAELDPDGAATYRFHTAETSAPQVSPAAVATALATAPRAFHLGTLGLVLEPMASALAGGAAGASPDTLVMLDPNCRPAVIAEKEPYLRRLEHLIARADVVKVSADDLEFIEPGVPAVGAARAIAARGPAVVLLTDGARPVLVVTVTGTVEVAVPPVAVVDTIGAGDAFGGAFLACWIERGFGRAELADAAAVRDATTRAVEVAALTCQRPGADPPHRDGSGWPPVHP
jgi:fructokinase